MSKTINRDELNSAIRNIINESLNNDIRETYDGREKFGIRRYVSGLIEEGHKNPKLMSYLLRYDDMINKGVKEFMVFEQFGKGLESYETGNKSVKAVLESMNAIIDEYGHSLKCFKLLEQCQDQYTRETVTECYNEYLAEPCAETKANLTESLDNFYAVNMELAAAFNVALTEQESNIPMFNTRGFINESVQEELDRKLDENRKEKQAKDIFAKVEKYLKETYEMADAETAEENERLSLQGIANNNGLNLCENINTVLSKVTNENVRNILHQYADALAAGAYEERLYETLLQNTLKYNYLVPVDDMRKKIIETVEQKKDEITLTKLLEMMRDSAQSYIYVELIQEDVARYVTSPNPNNRVQLRNALVPYAADPYVNEMLNVIYSDDTLSSNTLTEQAMSIKDQINIIKENATVSKIYTPVQYIRENESIFNVHGQYYVKKGSTMYALNPKYISRLDEKFVELCHLVNDPHVTILDDHIVLSGAEHYATIYEGYVDIDGYRESAESLRNLNEMCMKYENYDTNFYIMCSCLLENFNNIAEIDFAKHVTLNENQDITADLFKIDENIFMATHNNALMKHTFYTNVNPIFCKNTLNEHMGINVSTLFSDLLPDQDKIILRLNEAKNEYEESIKKYEDMIEELTDAVEDSKSEEMTKELNDAIAEAEAKLAEIKDEYKAWQEETEEMTHDTDAKDDENEDEEGADVTHEKNAEPLDKDEVDQYKDELATPLSQTTDDAVIDTAVVDGEAETEGGSEVVGVSDDEFNAMLQNNASGVEDTTNAEEDTVIDTDVIDNTPVTADAEDDYTFVAPEDEVTDDNVTVADTTVGNEPNVEVASDEDDDDIFDIADTDDDETDVVASTPAVEDVPSDEDIIIGDDYSDNADDTAVNTAMTSVDAETGEDASVDATDIFGGNVDEPLAGEVDDTDSESDLYNPGTETSEFNIVNVMFDGNVNDGTINKSGEVMVLRPMVDAGGKKYVESKTIHFYLNAETNTPIIQADDAMSTAMHNAIVDAITNHPQYDEVCANGIEATGVVADELTTDTSDDNWEAEYDAEGNEEDKGNFELGAGLDGESDDVPEEIDTDVVDATPSVDDYIEDYSIEDEDENPEDSVLPTKDVAPVVTDTTVDDDDDDFDFSEIFGDTDVDDVADSVTAETDTEVPANADPVQTYTDEDGTEIEVAAPEAETDIEADDDIDINDLDIDEEISDIIPESKTATVKTNKINENRKSILSVKSTVKK